MDVVGGITGYLRGGNVSNSYNKGILIGDARGSIAGIIENTVIYSILNTYYYATDDIKGIPDTDDVEGKYQKTDINLDTFETFKKSSFYANI